MQTSSTFLDIGQNDCLSTILDTDDDGFTSFSILINLSIIAVLNLHGLLEQQQMSIDLSVCCKLFSFIFCCNAGL